MKNIVSWPVGLNNAAVVFANLLAVAGGVFVGEPACSAQMPTPSQNERDKAADAKYTRLIQQLGDDDAAVRDEASRLLKAAKYGAVPWLAKASKSPDAEVRRRANEILQQFKTRAVIRNNDTEVLRALPYLPQIQSVVFIRLSRNDDLAYLAKAKHVFRLEFVASSISDDGFKHLAELGDLTHLTVDSAKITGIGFQYLAKLQKLRYVTIGGPVSDDGISAISKLPNLKKLELIGPEITDIGLNRIASSFPKLVQLHIGFADKITEKGIMQLAKHSATSIGFVQCQNISVAAQNELGKKREDARLNRIDESKE